MGTPNASEIETDTTPARSDARVPKITRASTSRPISSVPNQCAADGALRTALQLVAIGSYGDRIPASTATAMKNTTTPSATMAPRRRASRLNARRPGEASRTTPTASAVTEVMVEDPSSLAVPQARVHHEIGEIGDKIERDVRGRRAQYYPLHDGVIAVEHCVDDELAEARNGEHLLGEHRTGEERSELQRRERDRRRE